MRPVDFSPFYRSTVGFDRLFQLLDGIGNPDLETPAYPPYNIERLSENAYRISMAVAGFTRDDINIEVKEQTLSVKGEKKVETESGTSREFLHRGIAQRAFERRFQLADHVEVTGADLQDGLLHVDLKRNIPERMKPRQISIGGGKDDVKQLKPAA
jgi:molecular chaperone IbpA